MTSMWFRMAAMGLAMGVLAGCNPEMGERTDYPQENPEIAFAKGMKDDIATLKTDLQSPEGLGGVASDLESMVEGMEYLEQNPLGEHKETYFKIRDGVKELQKMVKSGASKKEVGDKLDELIALANTLPGDASDTGGGEQPLEPVPEKK